STSVTITIPSGATSGPLAVAVAPSMNSSNAVMFTVTTQPLPASWLDQDVGQVGKAGSASYANGTCTVRGSGQWIGSTADGMHFVYQPLLGDGTMVARVVSAQGGSSYAQAGVMIRETLSPGSTQGYTLYQSSLVDFSYRTSTGASTTQGSSGTLTLPYWVKVVRSGSTFSGYNSLDGVNWTQVGTAQTINMAQNVYIGLAVSSDDWASSNPPTLATGTFANVSVSSTAVAAPVMSAVSATTGTIGSQVVISGTGFGASQGNSVVTLNGGLATINSWSSTSVTITIPSGATSGPLAVAVAPSMNSSNAVMFTVTTQPLPASWLDQDVGQVGKAGSASYANGTFTVRGSGQWIWSTADGMHFVYQPLLGDGTMVARVVSAQGGSSYAQAGVMIRETLSPGSTQGYTLY